MKKNVLIFYNRIREQLWFRPLLFCSLSVFGALLAHQADGLGLDNLVPNIEANSIESLLDTISASMLVISIFTVASMLSAFSSASSTATPRSFKIVVTDDVSQNALSMFIGAFIFSIVATVALDNGYYDKAGRFLLFLFTLILFGAVILTFLRWVNRISRLGRLEHTIQQVEKVVAKSLTTYIQNPYLKAKPLTGAFGNGKVVYADKVGYVQNLNLGALQKLAEAFDTNIRLHSIPGQFVNKNTIIAQFSTPKKATEEQLEKKISNAVILGDTRLFDEDPRFGLIALTEIASRALSPGINDPGTAIQIIGSHERLFFLWKNKDIAINENKIEYHRIEVPKIDLKDFLDDAFRPIARDGAANIEVMLRLQKTFNTIASLGNEELKTLVNQHASEAYQRAENAMEFQKDLEILKEKHFKSHSY